ncbi:hypothetical protein INT47_009373 [Mucor saturninus]|uniref:Uncharacterized protein n=1 Tax=Mucor saturninus TaxID=64648 RepID=A0A8H7R734_9FUNG|nr:hypothetical protein INT47_009373 [Mucor saturninus]
MKEKVERKEKQLERKITEQEKLSQADKTAYKNKYIRRLLKKTRFLLMVLRNQLVLSLRMLLSVSIQFTTFWTPSNNQSYGILGLNSILDLSAQYPERQTTLFNKNQWEDISNICPVYKFNDTLYRGVDEAANSIFNLYKSKHSTTRNWNLMYQQVITLKGQYNAELNDPFRDIDFYIDTSEWDMIVKFWDPVMERFFTGTGLRLKWSDMILTMDDMTSVGHFKVDMRVINDSMIQRLNNEKDLAVAEAAKRDPGVSKYQSDRCKLLCESKVIIDNFVAKGRDLNSVYSIKFRGLEMMIISLSLFINLNMVYFITNIEAIAEHVGFVFLQSSGILRTFYRSTAGSMI